MVHNCQSGHKSLTMYLLFLEFRQKLCYREFGWTFLFTSRSRYRHPTSTDSSISIQPERQQGASFSWGRYRFFNLIVNVFKIKSITFILNSYLNVITVKYANSSFSLNFIFVIYYIKKTTMWNHSILYQFLTFLIYYLISVSNITLENKKY